MSISSNDMQHIEKWLLAAQQPVQRAQFRAEFPQLSFSACDASDMSSESPYKRYAEFDLYLIDTHEHCVRLTGDLAAATGVLVARRAGARP